LAATDYAAHKPLLAGTSFGSTVAKAKRFSSPSCHEVASKNETVNAAIEALTRIARMLRVRDAKSGRGTTEAAPGGRIKR
jgi:hypothetical protein